MTNRSRTTPDELTVVHARCVYCQPSGLQPFTAFCGAQVPEAWHGMSTDLEGRRTGWPRPGLNLPPGYTACPACAEATATACPECGACPWCDVDE